MRIQLEVMITTPTMGADKTFVQQLITLIQEDIAKRTGDACAGDVSVLIKWDWSRDD